MGQRYDTTRAVPRRPSRPRKDERPYLIGISGEHAGRLFPLTGRRELLLGRTEDCDIRISLDDLVSRRHARLEADRGSSFTLHDLESLNGTRVNGHEIRSTTLQRGDWVEVGELSTYKFDYLSDEERAQRESGSVDALTEVWNRKHFDEQFPTLFDWAQDREQPLSILMVDVDHFKRINDNHGHQGGDHALQRLASTIQSWLEEHASVDAKLFRYGGEEFAVLAPDCSAQACRGFGEGLRTAIEKADIFFAGSRLEITVSIGAATLEGASFESPEDMFRLADENLYKAKDEGRNRFIV